MSNNNTASTASGILALICLMGVSKSQAQTIVRSPSEPANVERILGLVVNEPGQDSIWNVDFVEGPLQDFYGPFPGTFTFTTNDTSENAVDAINAVLNSVDDMPGELPISSVGPPREFTETPVYNIAFDSIDAAIPTAVVQQGFRSELDLPWERTGEPDFREFFDVRIYAVFSPVPEPSAGLLMFLGLAGLGAFARRRTR